MRRFPGQLRGAPQGLQRVFQIAMLGVDGAQLCQFLGVLGSIQLFAGGARSFARAVVQFLRAVGSHIGATLTGYGAGVKFRVERVNIRGA